MDPERLVSLLDLAFDPSMRAGTTLTACVFVAALVLLAVNILLQLTSGANPSGKSWRAWDKQGARPDSPAGRK